MRLAVERMLARSMTATEPAASSERRPSPSGSPGPARSAPAYSDSDARSPWNSGNMHGIQVRCAASRPNLLADCVRPLNARSLPLLRRACLEQRLVCNEQFSLQSKCPYLACVTV